MSEILKSYFEPLEALLSDNDVNELMINRPGEIWIEKHGEQKPYLMPELNYKYLRNLSNYIATYNDQTIDETQPLLSGHLPNGCRVQIVLPPATISEHVILSIRRYKLLNMTLDDYADNGAFDSVNQHDFTQVNNDALIQHYDEGHYLQFIKSAIQQRLSMMIIGGTSTGKTTFINACLAAMSETERLVIIEDALEVKPPQQNIVKLLYSRNGQGVSQVNAQQLLEASLRLNPDRIILGECRGSEAFTLLRALCTGHPGSITSINAD